MIILNETGQVILAGDERLLPGSNVVEKLDFDEYPMLQYYVECGKLIIDPPAVRAVERSNSIETIEKIEQANAGNEAVKTASKKRKKKIEDFDKKIEQLKGE